MSRFRHTRFLLPLVLLLGLGLVRPRAEADPAPASRAAVTGLIDLLSMRLRLQRLSAEERRALATRLERGESPSRLYTEHVDRWLTRDFYRKLMAGYLYVPAASHFFLGPLSRYRERHGGRESWVYYLPHTLPAGARGDAPPCPPEQRVRATPWWSQGQPITLCADSYRPERAFDEVGYCAGQAEPTVPTLPRPGCGCGPLLLACLPPVEESPGMEQRVVDAMVEEVSETGAEIAFGGRSYDELMTVSTTWQNGLMRFLYLRRELLAQVRGQPYTPELEARLQARLAAVDVDAPGAWVERQGLYRGSGLFLATPILDTVYSTQRAVMNATLSQFLCVDFHSVNVTSEQILATAHGQHAGLRFQVYESPMRKNPACSGCHAPMDYGVGFLVGLEPPLLGSATTGRQVEGRLYLKGADDFRGAGVGPGALASLITRQPEFTRCAVARLFTTFVGRPPLQTADEQQLLAGLTREFEQGGRRVDSLVRAILLSRAQTDPLVLTP